MWVGEQISERGIGNGISLLIYAGIAARIPQGIGSTLSLYRSGELSFFQDLACGGGHSRDLLRHYFRSSEGPGGIPIQYAKRIVGRKVYGGQNTKPPPEGEYLGCDPAHLASSLIMYPGTPVTEPFFPSEKLQRFTSLLQPGGCLYDVLFVVLIVFSAISIRPLPSRTDDASRII